MNIGIHKETYRGCNIYWSGSYSIEGSGWYSKIADARRAIDDSIAAEEAHDRSVHATRLEAAKARGLWAERAGDAVVLHTPDGVRHMTIRQYRNEVFDLEEKYNADIVFQHS